MKKEQAKEKEIDDLFEKFIKCEETLHQAMYHIIAEPDFKTDLAHYIGKVRQGGCNKHNHVKMSECIVEAIEEIVYNKAVLVANG